MDRIFQQSYHIPGTLAANVTIHAKLPCDAQLLHISAVATTDSDATLIVGPSTDTDGYLASATIGDSSVPKEFRRADFVGAQYPHIAKGTIIIYTLDFDGSSGTAAANVTLVATFSEG